MRSADSIEAAFWITERLHGIAVDVGSVVPSGFERYVRIFHPAYKSAADGTLEPVRWGAIAAANARDIRSEMNHLDFSCTPSEYSASNELLWDQSPMVGSMPPEIAHHLETILVQHTQTSGTCWFAVWDGLPMLEVPQGARKFRIPGRSMYLLKGAISDVRTNLSRRGSIHRSPNLWWPDDRAWCVATDIDFRWTYVGGTAHCVREILAEPAMESHPTDPGEGNLMEK